MINLDSLTLKFQLDEIIPILKNGRIQKIQQLNRRDLLFTVRNNASQYKLFISINPNSAHISVIEEENKHYRFLQIPQFPPMFCMLLRKHLEGVKILDITQPEHERIIEFHFNSYGDLGEHIPLVLAVELMGKHSNVILYNNASKIILGCMHNVGEEKSKERELAGLLPYIYPKKHSRLNILKIGEEDFLKLCTKEFLISPNWLNETFFDISVHLAKELLADCSEDCAKIYNNLNDLLNGKRISPSVKEDLSEFSIYSPYDTKFDTVNKMVDFYFSRNIYKFELCKKRNQIAKVLNKEIKKINSALEKIGNFDKTLQKAKHYKEIADTLMTNLYSLKVEPKITAANIYTQENLEISLKPELSINENAQKYYNLYNKLNKSVKFNAALIQKYNGEKEYLTGIKSSLEFAADIEDLNQIEEELVSINLLTNKEQSKKKDNKIDIEKVQEDGFAIYIGKNNKQNDYLISKLASAEDLWLHAQGAFGGHVIIKPNQKGMSVSDEILLKAAKLAGRYSSSKNDKKISVIYTKRKYLKRPPNTPLGYVTHTNEKTIVVEN
ncbi:MAG: NFACT RNA binding domain-containing protein [Candidatus Gastranaerophilales bacterium]|nr:NFACT RNA binding domain-containing protein [Candidatus Gastranaerophilales bacterium]